ncbi:MAG: D-alanyl-D-alanine carboxypeptidase family protein [Pseudomonadota bacterium]|nr:D-alanyl-D-alanine carboxypeptidase family protein [Pseudomonadota bacterium]
MWGNNVFKKALYTLTTSLLLTTQDYAINLNAESYYIVEQDTGSVVLEKNADLQMGPASLTKMMTAYLLFEAIERGDLTLETMMPISEKAWRTGGSKMFLEVGKTVKTEDLIKGILVSSGNDACIVAAEFLSGTEDAFAMAMTDKAVELGMLNTTFKNASGWPHPEQVSTAKDMATLGRAIIKNFPQYHQYFSIPRFTYSDISQPNRNGLLRRNVGVDGLKTGHIEDAGYHLVASAERNGIRLISAVMGTDSSRSREDETLTGLSYAFRTNSMIEAVQKGQVIDSTAEVWMGEKETVKLKAAQGYNMYVSNRDKNNLKAEATFNTPVQAPVELDQRIGTLTVTHPTTGEQHEIALLAAEAIPEKGFMGKLGGYILHGLGL